VVSQSRRRQTAKTPRSAKSAKGLVVVFNKILAFLADLGG
jgi:hypothetical protein